MVCVVHGRHRRSASLRLIAVIWQPLKSTITGNIQHSHQTEIKNCKTRLSLAHTSHPASHVASRLSTARRGERPCVRVASCYPFHNFSTSVARLQLISWLWTLSTFKINLL